MSCLFLESRGGNEVIQRKNISNQIYFFISILKIFIKIFCKNYSNSISIVFQMYF